MKQYLETIKITFKAQMAYRFDVIFGALLSFGRIALAYILWSAIYSGRSEIAGFSFSMMLTYYIITSFFNRLNMSESMIYQISLEIREGQFAKYLVKPMNPLLFFMASCYAKTLFILSVNCAATIVFGLIFNEYFLVPDALSIIRSLIICVLGLNFTILLNFLIAIMSFKYMDITGLNIFKAAVLEFLSGMLIPLSLLPVWLQNGMKFFPFYYTVYYPALLFLNNRGTDEFYTSFAIMIFWNIIMIIAAHFTYCHLRRKFEGAGI